MKTCNKCGEEKPLEAYSRSQDGRDGRIAVCRVCIRARNARYYTENAERLRASKTEYRAENPETVREQESRYRAGHRGQQAEYYAANRDRIRARKAKHRAANREQYAARDARFRAENPHNAWESYYLKRSREFGFDPVVESFTRDQLIARYGDACAHCGGPFEQLDHYPVPVSRGGSHTLDNCRPSCAACNHESWKDHEAAQQAV